MRSYNCNYSQLSKVSLFFKFFHVYWVKEKCMMLALHLFISIRVKVFIDEMVLKSFVSLDLLMLISAHINTMDDVFLITKFCL